MRVIAGTYRSRLLAASSGTATRPTSDRLRETLFNVLAPRIADACFADLYAGSGAVGIEAISRGARQVYFSEASRAAADAIRANLRSLNIHEGFLLESGGTPTLLKRLQAAGTKLDVVFLDPPYEQAEEYTRTLAALGAASEMLLAPAAIVVAEHSRKLALAEGYGSLHRTRVLTQGDAVLSFYAPIGETPIHDVEHDASG